MAKPICVVYVQPSYGYEVRRIQEALSEAFPDYYVLALPAQDDRTKEYIRIDKVFYEKDFTEVDYEAFRNYIESELTKLKSNDKAEAGY